MVLRRIGRLDVFDRDSYRGLAIAALHSHSRRGLYFNAGHHTCNPVRFFPQEHSLLGRPDHGWIGSFAYGEGFLDRFICTAPAIQLDHWVDALGWNDSYRFYRIFACVGYPFIMGMDNCEKPLRDCPGDRSSYRISPFRPGAGVGLRTHPNICVARGTAARDYGGFRILAFLAYQKGWRDLRTALSCGKS